MSRFWPLPPLLVRSIIALVALGAIAAMSGVAYLEISRNQTVVLSDPTGPYQVGRTAYDWVDDAREDPLAPTGGTKRELLVWVWYPAAPGTQGTGRAQYLPADWRVALEQDRGLVGTQLFQNLAAVRVHAVAGAAVSDAQHQFPVLVFIPGYGNVVPYYTTLAEDLASHGYVVVGINPTYTTTIVFPDGRVTRRSPAGTIPETSGSAAINATGDRLVGVWAADARFVLDRLTQLNAEAGGPFVGRLDLSRIGLFGHSLGGAAALEACRLDSRCKAAVDMETWRTSASGSLPCSSSAGGPSHRMWQSRLGACPSRPQEATRHETSSGSRERGTSTFPTTRSCSHPSSSRSGCSAPSMGDVGWRSWEPTCVSSSTTT